MFNYLIFLIIALILIFVIYIGGKGLSRGIEAKSKLKEEKNRNIKKSNIDDDITKLNDRVESYVYKRQSGKKI